MTTFAPPLVFMMSSVPFPKPTVSFWLGAGGIIMTLMMKTKMFPKCFQNVLPLLYHETFMQIFLHKTTKNAT